MLLILTHEKTDFDAVASQLGAYKLFPAGTPLLPRDMNRNVQQFLNLYWDALPFVRPEDWRRQRVDEVILVDTHGLNSVRGLVRNPSVRVIDHHVGQQRRKGWSYQVEPVGATTTLLVEMLQASGLAVTPEEATLLLLGIYEDTGSLTYDTSTGRDARAAAWLLDQDAQLDAVRRFLSIPLTPDQQQLFERLQANAEWLRVHGHSLLVASATVPEGLGGEISSVAHRLRETLLPTGLFVFVQIGSDVQMVARSTSDDVDVAKVAGYLGGGGHSRAAAALVVNSDVDAIVQRIKAVLPDMVKPIGRVAEIMSHGVQTVPATTTVREAGRLMRRTGHEGYPVVDEESGLIKGLLTRHDVDRALSHELGELPVSRVMKAGAITVRPSESIDRVQELMLKEGWGQIPVVADVDEGQERAAEPLGIVTRTDLLNYWFKPAPDSLGSTMRNLLAEFLAPPLWALVQKAGAEAAELGMPLYFVGGLVRDLLLKKPAADIDLVVEGDAILLVDHLQSQLGGEVHAHRRFGTAKWFLSPAVWHLVGTRNKETKARPQARASNFGASLPDSIDFVTARSEFYTEPSALPEVERGSIKLDLHRRDFTINTLAIRLDGAHLGQLLDFYGGRRDLEDGLIRVLHSLSFIDDPTRIVRAVRLEQRLEFAIEGRTLELLRESLPMLARVTGDRIRHELESALREADPLLVMKRLAELGVMEHIEEGLAWTPAAASYFQRAPAFLNDPLWAEALPANSLEFLYFALWLVPLDRVVQEATIDRLRTRKATREDVPAVSDLLSALWALPARARPSEISHICRPFRTRVLLAARIVLGEEPEASYLDRYFEEWRRVKTALTGEDLRAMGLSPGPLYAELLEKLLDARIDGLILTEEQERAFLASLLAGNGAKEAS